MTEFGPIGEEVYRRTYSRTKADGTKETWPETVRRTVEGNAALDFVPEDSRERSIELIEQMKMMPAGRHLWVSGVPGRQYLFNCHRAGWDETPVNHFAFVFDELMKGGGIGANYSNEYLESYHFPNRSWVDVVFYCNPQHPDYDEVNADATAAEGIDLLTFDIPDTREGWVQALRQVLNAHWHGTAKRLVLNVSNVRPRGSLIRGFGGTASGPGPLVEMLRNVNNALNSINGRMTSLDAMKIDHLIAECVIAGNVRRSARMSIKHWWDDDILEFIHCKNDSALHWTTNISVEIDEDWFSVPDSDPHKAAVKDAITEAMYHNGEPGLFNSYLASDGEDDDVRSTNPCGEIALNDWENCNLGHINLARIGDDEELLEALELMTRFLIRATFSDITDSKQREVVNRNRRIGVGIYGFQEWCIKRFNTPYSQAHSNPEIASMLRWMYDIVCQAAQEYAHALGIPEPVKVTTVAPTGTIAKLSGNTEGIHPVYAKYFIRRVRYSADDPALNDLDESIQIEDDIYSANTKVASFYCADQIFIDVPAGQHDLIESADEISLSDMMAVLAMVQENWADNAISYTMNFNPDEYTAEELGKVVFNYADRVKGVTVMPDGSRPQAPYERVDKEQVLLRQGMQIDASQDDCATGACPVK